jgi:hypothetical protein
MPKTKLYSTDGRFNDFEPPATTDGSYLGTMKYKKATEAHLQKKFEEELVNVQSRLKAAKTKVSILVNRDSLGLQATLPIRPGDKSLKNNSTKQYKIFLGIPANLDGLKTAEEEAYELGKLIARKQFEWTDKYLGKKRLEEKREKTIGELLEKFEEKYFETHKRRLKSENSFRGYMGIIKKFDTAMILNDKEIINAIQSTFNTESYRRRAKVAISVFCKSFKIQVNLNGVFTTRGEPNKRNIPSDLTIIQSFDKFETITQKKRGRKKEYIDNWKCWRWIYGMLATYGLRPRELFVNPHIDWWLAPENKDNTWHVDKECKTGERKAFPLYPEWVELFDLKNPEYLRMLKHFTADNQDVRGIATLVQSCGSWFRKLELDFQPYNLRHAWAIRAHMLGIPIKAAADNLGHSVEMHTETYQRYFGEDNRRKAINQALQRKIDTESFQKNSEILEIKVSQLELENQSLKVEIERMKLENDRLKMLIPNISVLN